MADCLFGFLIKKMQLAHIERELCSLTRLFVIAARCANHQLLVAAQQININFRAHEFNNINLCADHALVFGIHMLFVRHDIFRTDAKHNRTTNIFLKALCIALFFGDFKRILQKLDIVLLIFLFDHCINEIHLRCADKTGNKKIARDNHTDSAAYLPAEYIRLSSQRCDPPLSSLPSGHV